MTAPDRAPGASSAGAADEAMTARLPHTSPPPDLMPDMAIVAWAETVVPSPTPTGTGLSGPQRLAWLTVLTDPARIRSLGGTTAAAQTVETLRRIADELEHVAGLSVDVDEVPDTIEGLEA